MANDMKITESGTLREFYYLDGNTIIIRENGTTKHIHNGKKWVSDFISNRSLGSFLSPLS